MASARDRGIPASGRAVSQQFSRASRWAVFELQGFARRHLGARRSPFWSGTIGGGARAHVRRRAIRLQTAGSPVPKIEFEGKLVSFPTLLSEILWEASLLRATLNPTRRKTMGKLPPAGNANMYDGPPGPSLRRNKSNRSVSRRSLISTGWRALAAANLIGMMPKLTAAAPGGRSVVCLYLLGGSDGNSILAPLDSAQYDAWAASRGELAIPQIDLLPV